MIPRAYITLCEAKMAASKYQYVVKNVMHHLNERYAVHQDVVYDAL